MKRLLIPLLAALALPNAVNAFPFGNNVLIENNVGEKILIKGKTVSTKNFYKKDLINLVDKNIQFLEEDYSYTKKQTKYYENKYLKRTDYCNKNYFSCYSSMEDFYTDPVKARYL